MLYPSHEPKVELYHICEFAEEAEGLRLCRIPERLRLTLNEVAQRTAQSVTGQFRDIVQDSVRRLNHPGIVGIPARDLLTPEFQSFDLVHPSQAGMEQIARRLHAAITAHDSHD